MATTRLPSDFSEFLRLLTGHQVEYLLVGGYAVAYHGYPRATGDMDIWVRSTPENAARVIRALQEFGFNVPELQPELFLQPERIIRMGVPPLRIELFTSFSGVAFAECYAERVIAELAGIPVALINLRHLRLNKQASGRHKDLADLEHLPAPPPEDTAGADA